MVSSSATNGKHSDEKALQFVASAGKPLESETVYVSPVFPDSFQFPFNPDPFVPGNDYSIYDEMRDDDQIKVALALKKDMVINSGWAIECEDEKIKEFITDNLTDIGFGDNLDLSFEDALRDMLSIYDYGFSLSEVVYNSPKRTRSGLWEIKAIKTRPPHTFKFEIDVHGNVLKIIQVAEQDLEFKPGKFIHCIHQPDFGNPYGKADLRSTHDPWKAKKFILRMTMRYIERFAGPTAVASYEGNLKTGELTQLNNALQSIQDSTTLIIPKAVQIEFLQANRDSSDVYIKTLDMLNMWIGRSILVPDLLGVSGSQTSGGSLALGKEQFRVFLAAIKKDREALQRKINVAIIKPLVGVNFGDDVKCSFEFLPITQEDESKWIELWLTAANGKLFKPSKEEVNHLRRKTGFPEGEVETPEVPAAPERPGLPDPDETPGIPEENTDPSNVVPHVRTFVRKTTPHEFKMDFKSIQETLDDNEGALTSSLITLARKMAQDLIQQAKSKGILTKFRPERLKELNVRFQKEMNSLLKGDFVSLFKSSINAARREILPAGTRNFVEEDINPSDFEKIIRAESFKLVGDITSDILKRTENQILKGMKDGLSSGAISKLVMDDIKDHTENHIKTTVRTKTTEVFNAARKTFFDNDPIAKQIVVAYQYSAILDTRTSEVCRSLDEKVFNVEKDADFLARITPPLHFNCRSVLVPITKFEEAKRNVPPSLDSLKKKGGNLIQAEAGK